MTPESLARAEALAWADDMRQRAKLVVRAAKRANRCHMADVARSGKSAANAVRAREVQAATAEARRVALTAPAWVPELLHEEYTDRAKMWGVLAAQSWAAEEMREFGE